MIAEIIEWIVDMIGSLGYSGIFILMMVESSFVPFPSEVVMIPAGYLASKGEMHILIVVLCGLLGSLFGALINYYLAVWLGRPLLLQYGRYVMFNETHLQKMEVFFSVMAIFRRLPAG